MAEFAIAYPHVRKGIRILDPGNFSFWHQESEKCLPVESWIQDFEIRNLAQGIQNTVNHYNPNPSSTDNDLESSIWNPGIHGVESGIPEFMAWNLSCIPLHGLIRSSRGYKNSYAKKQL